MILLSSSRSTKSKVGTGFAALTFQHLLATLAAPVALPGCPETCGNLTVPYPFGTRQGCFREGFNLTCDETRRPPKLFLGDGVEVVDISLLDGTVRIHSKMLNILLNASSPQLNGSWSAGLTGSTGLLTVSTKHNRFVAMGCNLLANLIAHDTRSPNRYVSICAALCADGPWVGDTSCSGVGCCQTPVARPGLPSYGFQLSALTQTSGESSGYGAVFIAEQEWLSRELLVLQLDYFAEQQKIADSTVIPTVLEWSLDMRRDRDLFWGLDNLDLYERRRCISLNSIVVNEHDDDKNGRRARCNCSKGYEGNPYIADGCQAPRGNTCGCSGSLAWLPRSLWQHNRPLPFRHPPRLLPRGLQPHLRRNTPSTEAVRGRWLGSARHLLAGWHGADPQQNFERE